MHSARFFDIILNISVLLLMYTMSNKTDIFLQLCPLVYMSNEALTILLLMCSTAMEIRILILFPHPTRVM